MRDELGQCKNQPKVSKPKVVVGSWPPKDLLFRIREPVGALQGLLFGCLGG